MTLRHFEMLQDPAEESQLPPEVHKLKSKLNQTLGEVTSPWELFLSLLCPLHS